MGSTSCHVGNTYKDVLPPGLAYCGSGINTILTLKGREDIIWPNCSHCDQRPLGCALSLKKVIQKTRTIAC